MLADEVEYVIGVDTHRDQHALALVVARTGAVLAQHTVGADLRDYVEALRFANQFAAGARVWAVEGAGHYGAGFTRYLSGRGDAVIEVRRSARAERRLRGKDDPLDAVRAARSALATETLTLPRSGQHQEALRVLLLARRSAVDVRRLALVQLRCSRFRRSNARTADELAIVLTPTIEYIERRTSEGKTRREATRCLKRTSPATSTAYSNTHRTRLDEH